MDDATAGRSPVVLVTGASSGIGAATARLFLAQGWEVLATARDVERLRDVHRAGAVPLALDLADPDSVEEILRAVLRRGGVDVLVNNAGYGEQGAVEDVDPEAARRQLQANVLGPVRLAQGLIPAMLRRAEGWRAEGREQSQGRAVSPRIIDATSVLAGFPTPMTGWYAASKAAFSALTTVLRRELAPHGIAVVEIRPGPVRTGWHAREQRTMKAASGAGRYARLARSVAARSQARAADPRAAVAPQRVAQAILAAATDARPRLCVPVGRGGHLARIAEAVVPPRAMDAALRWYFR